MQVMHLVLFSRLKLPWHNLSLRPLARKNIISPGRHCHLKSAYMEKVRNNVFSLFCRFASDLIKCQTGIVDNYCDDTALNMHRNVTYERTAPLMEYLRCPEGRNVCIDIFQ